MPQRFQTASSLQMFQPKNLCDILARFGLFLLFMRIVPQLYRLAVFQPSDGLGAVAHAVYRDGLFHDREDSLHCFSVFHHDSV